MAKTKQRLTKVKGQNGRSIKVKPGDVGGYSHPDTKISRGVNATKAANEKPMDASAETAIQKAVTALAPKDRELFQQLVSLLEEHLGSLEAARLWLVTRSPAFESTPLAAIRKGNAHLVLALLQSQWGGSPIYA